MKTNKFSLTKILLCVSLAFAMLGASLFFVNQSKSVKAEGTPIDVSDTITITIDDWMTESGNATDCKTFSLRVLGSGANGYLYEYLVVNSSIQGYWNDNGSTFATTNGVDIRDYIWFNNASLNSIINENNTKPDAEQYKGTTFPLSVGGVYSPIALETNDSFAKFMVLKAWMPENGFVITIKSGFKLLLSDGNTIETTKDVSFLYSNGTISKVSVGVLSFDGLSDTINVMGGSVIGELPEVPEQAGKVGFWAVDGVKITADTVWAFEGNKTAEVCYATEVKDLLTVEYWPSQSDTTTSFFVIKAKGGDNYTILDSSLNCYWNDNNRASLNCGCDLMSYILIDGESARSIIDKNNTDKTYGKEGDTFPMNMGGVFAPVVVETPGVGSAGLYVRVLKQFKTEFVITVKAGFMAKLVGGEIVVLSEDVTCRFKDSVLTKQCTVSFSGTEDTIGDVTVYNGDTVNLPTLPERAGYDATWKINGEAVANEFEYWYNADVTAVAVYTAKTYTLTIDGEDPITVTYDEPIGELPSKVGYTLTYTVDDAPITSETVWNFTEDKTAVVTEVAKTYTLSFEGLDAEDNLTVTYDSAIGTLPAVPEQTGKVGRWLVDGVEITADTVWTIDSDKQAVADYTTFYSVTFDGENAVSVAEGGLVAEPTAPTKESTAEFDFTFDGWYNGEEKWNFAEDVVNSDLNLVAKFNENRRSYAVTFDGENETYIEYGATITEPTAPTKADTDEYTYTFDGWYNGEEKWDFATDVVTGELALVSKFTQTKRSYTVSFNVSGRDDVTLEDKTVEYGSTLDLTTLLDGVDLNGYTYTITVSGVEISTLNVVENITVDVTFTKVQSGEAGGCSGSATGVSMLSALAILASVVIRKKSR
ncbi:MAG: InlB B-repeat-containing protein [Clostridia bacterium]|nr:InlB B-repeat-containing protein [Clostridia bacterium]